MRILPLSDLHFEHHRDHGREFVASLDPHGVDLLVLAGDISRMDIGIEDSLTLFRKRFRCPIVYVHGNHEYFFSDRASVVRATKHAVRKLQGVHWLEGDIVEIDGQRILGTTLWYGPAPVPKGHPLLLSTDAEWARGRIRTVTERGAEVSTYPDFAAIEDFIPWVYGDHDRAVRFLTDNLREGDVVVTHFLPSQKSVVRRFVGAPSNCWFVTDVEPLIAERKPALWINGHTHDALDYRIGPTRVVCNPLGYVTLGPMRDQGIEFNDSCRIVIHGIRHLECGSGNDTEPVPCMRRRP